jgi:hypothetical protein
VEGGCFDYRPNHPRFLYHQHVLLTEHLGIASVDLQRIVLSLMRSISPISTEARASA